LQAAITTDCVAPTFIIELTFAAIRKTCVKKEQKKNNHHDRPLVRTHLFLLTLKAAGHQRRAVSSSNN